MLCHKKLYDLIEGDRFYFIDDRRRHIWQVDYFVVEQSSYEPWKSYTQYYLVDDVQVKKEVKYNLSVVWLRNAKK